MRQSWILVLVAALLLGLLAAGPAVAADPPAGGKATAGEAHGPKDMFGRSLDLAIWTWVVFLLLLFILGRYAWGPMLAGLKQREQTIHSALAEAHQAKDEAQKLRGQLQAEMNKAHDQVRTLLEEARRDAQHTTDEMVAKARTEISAERDRLRREIEMARDQALQQMWNQSANLATMISSKAIRRQLSAEDHRNLVDAALGELEGAVGDRRHFVRGDGA
jgi:F-type H+-transporting ATPase subunit b